MPISVKSYGRRILASAAFAACLAAAGCGGGGKAVSSTRDTEAAATPVAKPTASSGVTATRPHLRILAPGPGARTGETVTVRVRITGGSSRNARAVRYVLDGVLGRTASTHITFTELAPGRHHLLVELVGDRRVRAVSSFTAVAPARVTEAVQSEATPRAPEPATAPPAAPSAPTRTNPERSGTEHTGGEHTEHSSPPPVAEPEGAIPQGGAGDHDGDNSGGPSDGDGNV